MKPRVFVASSVEGLSVAYAAQESLEYDLEVTVWSQGVFAPSKSTLEELERQSKRFDAAIFVFAPDDVVHTRREIKPAIRDNVVFELGLFIGCLGRDKCFILKPRSFDAIHFPSDLLGVTPAVYDDARSDSNLLAALGPACHKIRRALVPSGSVPSPSPTPVPTPVPTLSPPSIESILLSQAFRLFFNPPKYSKRMVFASDGRIVEGNNKNEHSWRVLNDKLELVQLDGRVHSRFAYHADDGIFRHTNDPDTLSIRNQYLGPDVKAPGV